MTARAAHQIDTATSTGQQLANKFSCIADLLRTGQIPRTVGSELARALDKAEAKLERRSALAQLQRLLDPHQQQSLWWVACKLASRLERFRSVGLQRVKQGYRPPDAIEESLLALIDTGPQSAHQLWLELQDLTLKR